MLKRMKLVSVIIVMVIIAIVSMGINEALGILNMKKIHDNVNDIHKNNLVPIARLGGIRGSFLNIRIGVNKALLHILY